MKEHACMIKGSFVGQVWLVVIQEWTFLKEHCLSYGKTYSCWYADEKGMFTVWQ